MQINVSSNYKRLSRSLDTLDRKQLPFAFAKIPNETMKALEKLNLPTRLRCVNRAFFKASMFTGTAVRPNKGRGSYSRVLKRYK